MSKQKPLPPRRSSDTMPSTVPPLPPGGSSTGRPVEQRGADIPPPQIATILDGKSKLATAKCASDLALPHSHTWVSATDRYECYATYCHGNEDRFNELAKQMTDGGWELVSVVSHERCVTVNGNSGTSKGWMTFWKRLAMPQAEGNKVNESA